MAVQKRTRERQVFVRISGFALRGEGQLRRGRGLTFPRERAGRFSSPCLGGFVEVANCEESPPALACDYLARAGAQKVSSARQVCAQWGAQRMAWEASGRCAGVACCLMTLGLRCSFRTKS